MHLFSILLASLLTVSDSVSEQDARMFQLEEVTVSASAIKQRQMQTSVSAVHADKLFLEQHFEGSLSRTLSLLPGVQASNIGSSQSRPAIRGMGFNRLAVIHDGVRHEGQQWGDDHGLEIDMFSIDRVEVLKGPSALLYGSDAIGGALVLSSAAVPDKPIGGNVHLFMRSNNLLFGASARLEGRHQRFFWRAHATYQDYADYAAPTDSIEYYSYRIPLYHRTLRNTAGREADGSLVLGYAGLHLHSCVKIFETYAESGFFANAHGLEVRLSDIDYDRSRRDIDLPCQQVNHLKVLWHTVWVQDAWDMTANVAWQHNLRREKSEPVSHGYMPTPPNPLERQFSKHTLTANLHALWHVHERHTLRFGANAEWQHNRRSGWGFVIPDYDNITAGICASERWEVNSSLSLNAGVRYDYAGIRTYAYSDWYPTPVNGEPVYKERAQDLHRHFHSFTWSAGVNYYPGNWWLKANIGKGFRVPIAKELAADGINYHIFRYEQGNVALRPEDSYQADVSVGYADRKWTVQIDPFVGYFPNYIYLSPTAYYKEGLQVYQYAESRVIRTGAETQVTYRPLRWLELHVQGEYLFARQLSGDKRGYGLPFAPPWQVMPQVKFLWEAGKKHSAWDGYAAVYARVTGAQHDIVPPEKPTDGWWTLNLSAGQTFPMDKCTFNLTLNAENILNTKYYDHTSFYRLIDVPEAGWNVSVMASVDF